MKNLLLTFLLIPVSLIFIGQNEIEIPSNALLNQEGPFPCIDGMAGDYPCDGYDLLNHLTNAELGGSAGNDCWGWTDPLDNREYALMGLNTGTAFVDITNPSSPILLGNLPTHTSNSSWRDIKVFQNHAYIVSEASGHGMQVFDLTHLRNVTNPPIVFTEDAHYGGFGSAHNVVINENTGFAYPVGASNYSGGPIFVNISNPTTPQLAGGFDGDGYTHDAQVVTYIGPDPDHQNREVFFGANENTLTIVDITVKTQPNQLSSVGYSGSVYTHQGWLTEDHKYYLMDDEIDENSLGINTRTLIWDVQDLDNPFYIGDFSSSIGATDHNMYVKGDKAYQANYRGGLRVLDISDIANANLTEIGYFDTYPESNNAGYQGAWSNYPYFPSGNIIISTIDRGLFIVKASTTEPIAVTVKMALQGPYDAVSGLMSDNLRASGSIPLLEPYTAMGYNLPSVSTSSAVLNVTGNNAIVDWVLVELRASGSPSNIIESRAGLLQRDGDVITADGSSFFTFDPVSNNVEVAIRHRNHFGIRTSESFSPSAPINIDFTNPSTNLFGSNPVTVASGVNLLIAGDANGDGQINSTDKNNEWRPQNAGTYNYVLSTADFNLDAFVNSTDKNNYWRINNSKTQQLD